MSLKWTILYSDWKESSSKENETSQSQLGPLMQSESYDKMKKQFYNYTDEQ